MSFYSIICRYIIFLFYYEIIDWCKNKKKEIPFSKKKLNLDKKIEWYAFQCE
jgi:hypothetical protein